MKILHLCKKSPYPVNSGESLALHFLSLGLFHNNVELDLLVMNSVKDPTNEKEAKKHLVQYNNIDFIPLDNRVKILPAIFALIQNKSYHVSRFNIASFHKVLKEWLLKTSYDYVILETLYLSPYIDTIRQYSEARIIYRSHNIEHKIWERNTIELKSGIKKQYLTRLTKQLKKYESTKLKEYDIILPISPIDKNIYLENEVNESKLYTYPIGLDTNQYIENPLVKSFDIYFIGSLDWAPNIEGLKWFIKNIWPTIYKTHKIVFHIAGRNASENLINYLKVDGVVFHGEIDNASDFHQQHHTLLVPLNSGSGIRVKIIEGMALGKPIISTAIGAEGIKITHKKDILIANTLDEFNQSINWLKESEHNASILCLNALNLVSTQYDYKNIAKGLIRYLNIGFSK